MSRLSARLLRAPLSLWCAAGLVWGCAAPPSPGAERVGPPPPGTSTGDTPARADSGPSADQGTPGTFADWSWPSSVASLADADFLITVDVDPGPTSDVFWSTQFELGTSAGFTGYTGMQSNLSADGGRLFLLSVWGATDAGLGALGSCARPSRRRPRG